MSRYENYGNCAPGVDQVPVQLDAAHSWQAHIEQQTAGARPMGRIEKVFGAGECGCVKARGLQDAPQCFPEGFIVVDNPNVTDNGSWCIH